MGSRLCQVYLCWSLGRALSTHRRVQLLQQTHEHGYHPLSPDGEPEPQREAGSTPRQPVSRTLRHLSPEK